MTGAFKRWWYGPAYRLDAFDNRYYLAPMTWDLGDFERVRGILGAVGPTRLTTQ